MYESVSHIGGVPGSKSYLSGTLISPPANTVRSKTCAYSPGKAEASPKSNQEGQEKNDSWGGAMI